MNAPNGRYFKGHLKSYEDLEQQFTTALSHKGYHVLNASERIDFMDTEFVYDDLLFLDVFYYEYVDGDPQFCLSVRDGEQFYYSEARGYEETELIRIDLVTHRKRVYEQLASEILADFPPANKIRTLDKFKPSDFLIEQNSFYAIAPGSRSSAVTQGSMVLNALSTMSVKEQKRYFKAKSKFDVNYEIEQDYEEQVLLVLDINFVDYVMGQLTEEFVFPLYDQKTLNIHCSIDKLGFTRFKSVDEEIELRDKQIEIFERMVQSLPLWLTDGSRNHDLTISVRFN